MSNRIRISSSAFAVAKSGKIATSTTASDFLINTGMGVFIGGMLSQTLISSLDLTSFTSPTPTNSGSTWGSIINAVYTSNIAHNLGYIPSCFTSALFDASSSLLNTGSYTLGAKLDYTNFYLQAAYFYDMSQNSSYSAPGAGSPQIPSNLSIIPVSVTINAEKWL